MQGQPGHLLTILWWGPSRWHLLILLLAARRSALQQWATACKLCTQKHVGYNFSNAVLTGTAAVQWHCQLPQCELPGGVAYCATGSSIHSRTVCFTCVIAARFVAAVHRYGRSPGSSDWLHRKQGGCQWLQWVQHLYAIQVRGRDSRLGKGPFSKSIVT